MSQEEEEADILHIGNLVGILSERYGYVTGRIVYRNIDMIHVMPQEVSDRAIVFPMTTDGSAFAPELGVSVVEIYETQESDHYVDFLGVRPGEVLEFFTIDGDVAAPVAEVIEVINTEDEDAVIVKDESGQRRIDFNGIGPESPIAVVRVRTSLNVAAVAEAGVADEVEDAASASIRNTNIMELLRSVLPSATVEVIPTAERTYPDSAQREDMFQELLADLKPKQRTNPRRVRLVEREVDLALALKNRVTLRSAGGRILGPAPHVVSTLGEAISANKESLPAAIPVVTAAKVLNLDADPTADASAPKPAFNPQHVAPRTLDETEVASVASSEMYSSGAQSRFDSYFLDVTGRDLSTLVGPPTATGWLSDQDVLRTAGLGVSVQGLSSGLPVFSEKKPPVTLAYLLNDVQDRSIRVITGDKTVNAKNGAETIIAYSDPSTINSYVMLPPKVALALRPPKNPGDLPTALLYSAALQDANLPTIARTLDDLYSSEKSPQHAWTLTAGDVGEYSVASWLRAVLRYTVHPADSLGPRTPQLLSLLDALGLDVHDMSPPVAEVIGRWVGHAHRKWRDLLVENRKLIQSRIDAEQERTFQSVTGDSPLWPALVAEDSLKDLVEDIQRRNPTIAPSPTLLAGSLLQEAQGDATPLVWATIAKMDERPISIDSVYAMNSLAASRAYALRRKALRDIGLLSMAAAPEINTCPHVNRLEAVRNVRDDLERSRLLRTFVEEYQGGREGEWMTCAVCRKPCVCYHELMELEAAAQPTRVVAIQKQIMVKFGGERYEGKIVCKNCGQPLRDIDYDDSVEFDDDGNPIMSRAVLTEEQQEEETGSATRKAMDAIMPEEPVTFTSETKKAIYEVLKAITDRGGLRMEPSVIQTLVSYAETYVNSRTLNPVQYEQVRQIRLKDPKTKNFPTYEAAVDRNRVAAVGALLGIFLQSANPMIQLMNPFPFCKFSREGWPLAAPGGEKPEDSGPLMYVSCIVAYIQPARADKTLLAPWSNMTWAGEDKPEPRKRDALKQILAAAVYILGGDPKTGQQLPFTPELTTALERARSDAEVIRSREMVTLQDQMPAGFRPEPFPPKMSRPAIESDPLAAAVAAGPNAGDMAEDVGTSLRQQAIAIAGELHGAAITGMGGGKVENVSDTVCCPVPIRDAEAGVLLGAPEPPKLLAAREVIRGNLPAQVNTGTHLWPVFQTPVPVTVPQTVEEGVLFKLFLKYCYTGPQVGAAHEFDVGNICRQCGLVLGKPADLVDVGAEGAAILAAQQGPLAIQTTQAAFDALSDAIRRRKVTIPTALVGRMPWRAGLEQVAAVLVAGRLAPVGRALEATLAEMAGREGDAIGVVERGILWGPVAEHKDGLENVVVSQIGPLTGPKGKEATEALTMLEKITEDPFIEGPRTLQEYWCAKAMAAGSRFSVETVKGANWSGVSENHNKMIDALLVRNANWSTTPITDDMIPVLRHIAMALGPVLRAWSRVVRSANKEDGPWTTVEAQMLLRTIIFQAWADAVVGNSWMYDEATSNTTAGQTMGRVATWTRELMASHVKTQFVRFSDEQIKRVLQERAEAERTSIVEEFESIKDDDERGAVLFMKQFRIGRWGRGENIRKLDADQFDFEIEQRHKMGVVDAAYADAPTTALTTGPQDFGLGGLDAPPEDGYDMNNGAAGDDY
jgi:hypothetical protein